MVAFTWVNRRVAVKHPFLGPRSRQNPRKAKSGHLSRAAAIVPELLLPRNAQAPTPIQLDTGSILQAPSCFMLFRVLEAPLSHVFLGVDSPFFSTIVQSKNRPVSLGFRRFRRKDPWKERGRYP